jgi:hypothetical protein
MQYAFSQDRLRFHSGQAIHLVRTGYAFTGQARLSVRTGYACIQSGRTSHLVRPFIPSGKAI